MAISHEFIDFKEMFSLLRKPPIILNDLPSDTKEAKAYINSVISSEFTNDMISLLPSCGCGMTKGEFNTGVTCDICHTEVTSNVESDIEPLVWFRKPEGVVSLINPMVLMLLSKRFTKAGFSVLQWLCDTAYRPKTKAPKVLDKINELGLGRGYNNFVTNFDTILETLFTMKDLGYKPSVQDPLELLIHSNRHKIFSDYIPLPNKSLFIIESNNTGIYIDDIIIRGVDTIGSLVSIDRDFHDQRPRVKENRTAKALFRLVEFYDKFFSSAGIKEGLFRRHIFGTRTIYSFRCVATSITTEHNYDELELPWCVAVTVLRTHLVNKLLKFGMSLNSIIGLIYGSIHKYNPLLHRMLLELIEESPEKGIPISLCRNPTLLSGSILRLRVTKIKTDPTDNTISVGILIARSLNLDFDGDEDAV